MKTTRRNIALGIFALLAGLSACERTPLPPLTASDVEIRTPVPGMPMSVAYLTLNNNSDSAISISRISSPQFDRVELHETRIENGISSMHRIDTMKIPVGTTLQLEQGGKHLMLMQRIGQPDQVTLNLHSEGLLVLSLTAPLLEGVNAEGERQ